MVGCDKPLVLISHHRSCSTAFERVLMTRRDLFITLNEPYANAGFIGAEARAERARPGGQLEVEKGFETCTYATAVSKIERLNTAEKGKRVFIKDIAYTLGSARYRDLGLAPSLTDNPHAEPANPTAIPVRILRTYQWTFLIRHPRFSAPSMYRLTTPPMSLQTDYHYFIPSEIGYRELRTLFDFLLSQGIIGDGNLCVVDAENLLDQPPRVVEAYCRKVGIEYGPEMLSWDTAEADAYAGEVISEWTPFHIDVLKSRGLIARSESREVKTDEEEDEEWSQKFGKEAAAVIRETVNSYVDDYEHLKRFAMKFPVSLC